MVLRGTGTLVHKTYITIALVYINNIVKIEYCLMMFDYLNLCVCLFILCYLCIILYKFYDFAHIKNA